MNGPKVVMKDVRRFSRIIELCVGYVVFLANDLRVPEEIRDEVASLGITER